MADETTALRQDDRLRPEQVPWQLVYAMLGPPLVWSIHFLVIYSINALSCWAGLDSENALGVEEHIVAMALVTLVALALLGWSSWIAYQTWRRERDADDRSGWRAYVALTGLLLGGLFALAVVLETVPAFVVPPCA